jgi:tRNA threonylcarbamoyladenosine biosynthesis protein TsaE
MHLVSQGPEDTRAIAAKLAQRLVAAMSGTTATIVALRGDLGAGKTTFTQGFANALGVKEQPKSPTFNLAKRYAIPGTEYSLWHLDCYRLDSHKDLAAMDMHAVFADPRNLVLIEWPERIGDGLPRDRVEVHLSHDGGDKRGISISEK